MHDENDGMPSWIEKDGRLTLLGSILAWAIALTYGSYLIVRHGTEGAERKVEDMEIDLRREQWRKKYVPGGKI